MAFDLRPIRRLGLSPRRCRPSAACAAGATQRRRAEVNVAGAVGATALLPADRKTLLDAALANRGI